MVKETIFILLLFFSILLVSGCSSVIKFQTGEVLGKGNFDTGIYMAQTVDYPVKDQTKERLDRNQAEGGGFVRYGITNHIDLGLSVSVLCIGADIKYQFLRENKYLPATSIGFKATGIYPSQEISLISSKKMTKWSTFYV